METFNFSGAAQASKLTTAIKNKKKQQIIGLLNKHGEMTVTDLFLRMRAAQSLVSVELKGLRSFGIVNVRKDGKHRWYSLNSARLNQILDNLNEII